jgi:phage shock protein C
MYTKAMEHKKLYRSKTNRVFAGVCGGLSAYVDATALRLVWVLIVIFTGFAPGVLAYIIAIFVVPEEK